MYLENITGLQDVKKLNLKPLNTLAGEIRKGSFNRLTRFWGHCGPNIGFYDRYNADVLLEKIGITPSKIIKVLTGLT